MNRHGTLTHDEATAAQQRLSDLERRHRDILALIDAVVDAAKNPVARDRVSRLFTNGLVVGGRNDCKHGAELRAGRTRLAEAGVEARAALPSPVQRQLLVPADDPADASVLAGSTDVGAAATAVSSPIATAPTPRNRTSPNRPNKSVLRPPSGRGCPGPTAAPPPVKSSTVQIKPHGVLT